MKTRFFGWLLGFVCVLAPVPAGAQFVAGITGLHNTGESTAVGNLDPNYTLTAYPGTTALSAYVTNTYPGAWVPNATESKWIGPFVDTGPSDPSAPVGNYEYTLTFNIANDIDLDNVEIAGLWATDNYGLNVIVNDHVTQNFKFTTNSYATLDTLTLSGSGLFLHGSNTLKFQVTNLPYELSQGNPTGLNVRFTSAVPEPTTYALVMGAIVLGIVGVRRFRHRKQIV